MRTNGFCSNLLSKPYVLISDTLSYAIQYDEHSKSQQNTIQDASPDLGKCVNDCGHKCIGRREAPPHRRISRHRVLFLEFSPCPYFMLFSCFVTLQKYTQVFKIFHNRPYSTLRGRFCFTIFSEVAYPPKIIISGIHQKNLICAYFNIGKIQYIRGNCRYVTLLRYQGGMLFVLI